MHNCPPCSDCRVYSSDQILHVLILYHWNMICKQYIRYQIVFGSGRTQVYSDSHNRL